MNEEECYPPPPDYNEPPPYAPPPPPEDFYDSSSDEGEHVHNTIPLVKEVNLYTPSSLIVLSKTNSTGQTVGNLYLH